MPGFGEGGIGRRLVAEHDRHPDIAVRALLPDFGSAGFRGLLQIDQGGQRLIVDVDQLGGIAGLRLGFGDDEGDAVADATDAVGQQNRPRGRKARGSAPGFRHEERRDAADFVGQRVGAGEHAQHAGRRFRPRGVDAPDHRVRVRRQHRDAMALPR